MSSTPTAKDTPWIAPAAIWALAERELVRFFRQRNRVVGALGQPLIFWILFGAGLRGSFRPAGTDLAYEEYFFPGVVVMIVLFTAIFATISIIEDRQQGFLQGVLVAPVSRLSLVLGKVLGGTMIALIQAMLFLLIAPWAGFALGARMLFASLAFLAVLGVALTSLGVVIAWRMDSTQGFHAVMSVFLMPMWLLSGAFFPQAGAPVWLMTVMSCNPLTYAVAGLRRLMYLDAADPPPWPELPSIWVSGSITLLFAGGMLWIANRIVTSRSGSGP